MSEKNAKATNSEIVKSLIVLTQDFMNNQLVDEPGKLDIVDESNLVHHISVAMASYRRQRDRIADMFEDFKRIVGS